MTDEKLFELVKRVDPQAVRLPPGIKEIAAEIAAAEREACAKVCEEIASDDNPHGHNECDGAMACLSAIRARSNC